MFSSLLSELPQITFSGTNICINLKGYDYDDIYSEVELIFQEVHYFFKGKRIVFGKHNRSL